MKSMTCLMLSGACWTKKPTEVDNLSQRERKDPTENAARSANCLSDSHDWQRNSLEREEERAEASDKVVVLGEQDLRVVGRRPSESLYGDQLTKKYPIFKIWSNNQVRFMSESKVSQETSTTLTIMQKVVTFTNCWPRPPKFYSEKYLRPYSEWIDGAPSHQLVPATVQ